MSAALLAVPNQASNGIFLKGRSHFLRIPNKYRINPLTLSFPPAFIESRGIFSSP